MMKLMNSLNFGIMINKIEIDLTYKCNLSCNNCDRLCDKIKDDTIISLDTINRFIEETNKTNMIWKSIRLLGGEPTLHPTFLEILEMLDDYFSKYSQQTCCKVVSNNINDVPKNWKLHKSKRKIIFDNICDAPIDSDIQYDYSKGCWISTTCGLGLSPDGFYYSCAVAGSMERFIKHRFNIDTFNIDFSKYYQYYCPYCGHFTKSKSNKISNFWRMKLNDMSL